MTRRRPQQRDPLEAAIEAVLQPGRCIAYRGGWDFLGWVSNRPIHLVVADEPVEGHTIVVTVYEPDPEQWEPGFQRRRPVR